MPDASIAVQTDALSKGFGNRTVLRGVDLRVPEGQSFGFVGPNGSGKTTLLRCLAALLRPTSGRVWWLGRPAGADPADRHLVGVVAHRPFLYPHLTLRENLIFAARMCNLEEPARRADQLLDDVGLSLDAHRLPTQISQGMRQRMAVARAIVHDPPILLFDEPFAGLDTAAREWLLSRLLEFRRRGRTLCFAAHDEQLTRRLADRAFRLQAGRLEEAKTAEEPKGSRCCDSARAA